MTKPKTRPIIFSGPMVRAILDGRKTQTRRIVKQQWDVPSCWLTKVWSVIFDRGHGRCLMPLEVKFPYGAPGDRLWVRETWNVFVCSQDGEYAWPMGKIPKEDPRADAHRNQIVLDYPVSSTCGGTDGGKGPWRPSIHMPRWASRITLEITDVRVERLQDISEEDAMAEGCPEQWHGLDKVDIWFHDLWNSINGPDAWDANPWVWALTFKVVD